MNQVPWASPELEASGCLCTHRSCPENSPQGTAGPHKGLYFQGACWLQPWEVLGRAE